MDQENGAASESLNEIVDNCEISCVRRLAFAVLMLREAKKENPIVKDIIAWHGDGELKKLTVARMYQHRRLDDFIFGDYQLRSPEAAEGYKGCAVGCTLQVKLDGDGHPISPENGWWEEMQKQYGIPTNIAEMIDDLFEDCPDRDTAANFAVAVVEAIPVGAHLYDLDDKIQALAEEFNQDDFWSASRSKELRARFVKILSEAPVYPTIPSGESWGTPAITVG